MANHRNFAETTLAAAITDTSGTSITVTSETSFPAAPFIISIDTECLLVTVVSGTTWTVTRGYENSTAATHTNGTAICHDLSAAEADSIAAKLDKTGGTMSGAINMGNQDISYLKLLKLNGEIDDGAGSNPINWNAGVAHKVTLGADTTLIFTGGSLVSPTMTADNAPTGYVASASTVYSASGAAWHAFSQTFNADATRWLTAMSSVAPQWVQIQCPSALTISAYSVRSKYAAGWGTDPSAWTLAGSNNGTDWTTLDSQSGISFSANEKKSYSLAASASYLYYRLTITAPSTPSTPFSIDELELLVGIADPSTPCFLALKITQDATGGRKITWPANVKGTPLYDLAANAVTVLLFYWDGTYYWPLNNSGWVSTVPASATAKGITGQYTANGSYFYYCSATDTWVRAALATWT